ncbi:MAG: hypothetical protein JOZ81_35235 [Chloroflexi bacterium]|nr:hypothetical protein [Chloroflexota bacterium]
MNTTLDATRSGLTSVRPRVEYSPAEREFALLLKRRLDDLLQGKRSRLDILRKYPREPGRIGVIPTPDGFPLHHLGPDTLEELTWKALRFIQAEDDGGPIAQTADDQGGILEVQTFPTRYPHIVIERVDYFRRDENSEPDSITWSLHRVQNPRARGYGLLDATNLLFELVRLVR